MQRVTTAPWWETLGLPSSASLADAETAHRRLLQEHHPDRGGDPDAAACINRARDIAREALAQAT